MDARTLKKEIKQVDRYQLRLLRFRTGECSVVTFLLAGWDLRSVAQHLHISCRRVHSLAEGFLKRVTRT